MADATEQRQSERSPKYPNFGLKEAIEKVQQFWDKDQGAAAPKKALAKHWNYSPKSSGFLQAIGTLKQYGLLDSTGDGLLRPSKLARSIVMLEQDDPARQAAMQKAAQKPLIFVELRKEWPGRLPSDATMQHHLVDIRDFRPNAARVVVGSFKNTVDLMGSTEYDSREQDNLDGGTNGVKVGDLAQWTVNGIAQWRTKRRVTSIDDFEGKSFASVEAGDNDKGGHVPIEQLSKSDPAGESRLSLLEPILDPLKRVSEIGHMVSLTLPRGVTVSIRATELLTAKERKEIKNLIDFSFADGSPNEDSKES